MLFRFKFIADIIQIIKFWTIIQIYKLQPWFNVHIRFKWHIHQTQGQFETRFKVGLEPKFKKNATASRLPKSARTSIVGQTKYLLLQTKHVPIWYLCIHPKVGLQTGFMYYRLLSTQSWQFCACFQNLQQLVELEVVEFVDRHSLFSCQSLQMNRDTPTG